MKQVSNTNGRMLEIPSRPAAEIAAGFHLDIRRQLAAISDAAAIDDARRKLLAWAAYVTKREQRQEIAAASRWCEIRIGELLGKRRRGRPMKNDPTGSFFGDISHGDKQKFRLLARHKRLVAKLIMQGQVSRGQLLNAIKEAEQDGNRAGDTLTVETIVELAGQSFGCIYADPPWRYDNQGTRAATDNHYKTLSVDELCEWPVADVAADDAHLHLWTTNAFLRHAFRVIEAWGFEYRSCFVWVKPQMGIGNYWRLSHEFLLLGVRGTATRFNDKSLRSWGQFERRRHSSKPEEVRLAIEKASPGPFLELFGRKPIEGWTVLGDSIERRLFA